MRFRWLILRNSPPIFSFTSLLRCTQISNPSQVLAFRMGSHGRRTICPSCSKPSRLCLCDRFETLSIDNSVPITILQHSREKKHALNSTRIALLGLKNVVVAPVSDVHFRARFIIQSLEGKPSCSKRGSAFRRLDFTDSGKVNFHSTEQDSNQTFDFSSNLGEESVAAPDFGNGAKMSENVGIDMVPNCLRTHKRGAETSPKAIRTVSNSENRSIGNLTERFLENDDFGESQSIAAASAELEPFPKAQKEERPNTYFSSNAAAADANGALDSSWKYDERFRLNRALHSSGTLEAISGSCFHDGTHAAGLESSSCPGNSHFIQTIDSKNKENEQKKTTDGETAIVVSIAKPGLEFPLGNTSENPDFDKLSATHIGKHLISNGFHVKKLQTKQFGAGKEIEEFEITIPPGSALLFPSKKAVALEDVSFQVKHLVVLDGTWSKAKRMYHENPWLKLLPHLKLDTREQSLYNEVRHQPEMGCLSTIESIVYALKALSSDKRVGLELDGLLNVFESMVGDQRRCKTERLSKLSSG